MHCFFCDGLPDCFAPSGIAKHPASNSGEMDWFRPTEVAWCGNVNVASVNFSRISKLFPTPHAPCDVLYLVPLLIGC